MSDQLVNIYYYRFARLKINSDTVRPDAEGSLDGSGLNDRVTAAMVYLAYYVKETVMYFCR